MKNPRLLLVASALLALSPLSASAQAAAPSPAAVASAAPPTKPTPRLMTPDEKRETATLPGELRPERPAAPQLSIPLGKTPDKPSSPAAQRGKSATTGGVEDSVARCNAQANEAERAKCRDQLAKPATKP